MEHVNMYWPNAHEYKHYMRALKHRRMADECLSAWSEGDRDAKSAVGMIDCDVSYLEDAPNEELKSQSYRIGRIAERLREINDKLRQE
jgi:hypothetical protein